MANLWKSGSGGGDGDRGGCHPGSEVVVSLAGPRLAACPIDRLELDLGDSAVMRSTQGGSSSGIISPDGSRLVFVSFRNQEPPLVTRVLNEIGGSESVELPGTAGVRGPFFSPDGH